MIHYLSFLIPPVKPPFVLDMHLYIIIFEDEFTDEVIQKVISLSSDDPYLLPGTPAQSTTDPPGAQDQDGSPLPNAQARLNRQFDRVL